MNVPSLRGTIAALSIAAAVSGATPLHAAVFTVGPSTGCTHATLQAALDAADLRPGPDTVRIINAVEWTAQQASTDTDQDLEIVGGYFACDSAQPVGKTTLSGEGGEARSVIALRGNGRFQLRNLVLQDGDQAGDDDGGGLHFQGGGIVEIQDSEIADNSAEDGGGIYAQGTTPQAELIIGANVQIVNNTARKHGGGVVAQNLEMTMIAPGSLIGFNTAGGRGGGLIVASGEFASYAYVGSAGIGQLGAIHGNTAQIGGGIALLVGDDSGRDAVVQLFSADPAQPLRIRNNTANLLGGGIDLQPDGENLDFGADAVAILRNVIIEENRAPVGAAMHLAYDAVTIGYEGGSRVSFNTTPTMHFAAAPCPFGAPCGHVRNNTSLDPAGAVIHLANHAHFTGSRIAFDDNIGGRVFYLTGDEYTRIELDNSRLTGNMVQGSLIRNELPPDEFSRDHLHHLTVSGNTIGAGAVFSINNHVALSRSLIDQPGKTLLASGAGVQDVQHVLVSGTPMPPDALQASPRFVDAARDDYTPRAGSVAVDYAPPLPQFTQDLYSHTRDIDIPIKANAAGSVDVGAIEREFLQPLVLNENFDVDLTLWVASGATWDGTQNTAGEPGSGSVRVPMPMEIGGARAKTLGGVSQCVHLPGPGTYNLNGFARIVPSSNPPLVSNRASLAWWVSYSGTPGGCGGGFIDQSGMHPLATTSTWTRPASPAYIVIPESAWTPDTAVTIVTDVAGAPSNPPVAWFDGIRVDAGGAPPGSWDGFGDGFE